MAMAELQAGVARTSAQRKNLLTRWLLGVETFFQATTAILPFDMAAAQACARLLANGAALDAPLPLAQAMVAGVAEANGLILAAPPSAHLVTWGGRMVDPWATEMQDARASARSNLLRSVGRA